MDIETSEAIETLRADLRRVEHNLGGRIDDGETRLRLRIDGVEPTLRVEMGDLRDDLRRHFEISTENLRDDIRIVAEGLIALNAKVDRFLPPDSLH